MNQWSEWTRTLTASDLQAKLSQAGIDGSRTCIVTIQTAFKSRDERVGYRERVSEVLAVCLKTAVECGLTQTVQNLVQAFKGKALDWCDAADVALEQLVRMENVAPATRTALEDLLVPVCHGPMTILGPGLDWSQLALTLPPQDLVSKLELLCRFYANDFIRSFPAKLGTPAQPSPRFKARKEQNNVLARSAVTTVLRTALENDRSDVVVCMAGMIRRAKKELRSSVFQPPFVDQPVQIHALLINKRALMLEFDRVTFQYLVRDVLPLNEDTCRVLDWAAFTEALTADELIDLMQDCGLTVALYQGNRALVMNAVKTCFTTARSWTLGMDDKVLALIKHFVPTALASEPDFMTIVWTYFEDSLGKPAVLERLVPLLKSPKHKKLVSVQLPSTMDADSLLDKLQDVKAKLPEDVAESTQSLLVPVCRDAVSVLSKRVDWEQAVSTLTPPDLLTLFRSCACVLSPASNKRGVHRPGKIPPGNVASTLSLYSTCIGLALKEGARVDIASALVGDLLGCEEQRPGSLPGLSAVFLSALEALLKVPSRAGIEYMQLQSTLLPPALCSVQFESQTVKRWIELGVDLSSVLIAADKFLVRGVPKPRLHLHPRVLTQLADLIDLLPAGSTLLRRTIEETPRAYRVFVRLLVLLDEPCHMDPFRRLVQRGLPLSSSLYYLAALAGLRSFPAYLIDQRVPIPPSFLDWLVRGLMQGDMSFAASEPELQDLCEQILSIQRPTTLGHRATLFKQCYEAGARLQEPKLTFADVKGLVEHFGMHLLKTVLSCGGRIKTGYRKRAFIFLLDKAVLWPAHTSDLTSATSATETSETTLFSLLLRQGTLFPFDDHPLRLLEYLRDFYGWRKEDRRTFEREVFPHLFSPSRLATFLLAFEPWNNPHIQDPVEQVAIREGIQQEVQTIVRSVQASRIVRARNNVLIPLLHVPSDYGGPGSSERTTFVDVPRDVQRTILELAGFADEYFEDEFLKLVREVYENGCACADGFAVRALGWELDHEEESSGDEFDDEDSSDDEFEEEEEEEEGDKFYLYDEDDSDEGWSG